MRSALGTKPDELKWSFNKLARLTDQEASKLEKERAETTQIYSNSGLVDPEVLSEMAKNHFINSPQWPGAADAFADAGDDFEPGNPNNPDDIDEVVLPEERQTGGADGL